MGAAVASMLAMWVRHNRPSVQVACWAFACPPCVSLNLSESSRDYIFGLIIGDDVIPRLSVESLALLKRRLKFVLDEGPGFWSTVTGGMEASALVEQRLKDMGVIRGTRWDFESQLESDYERHAKRLWPPVRQLYLYEVGDRVVAEESDCKHFGNVILSNSFFKHHLPMEYDRVLIKLIKAWRLKEKDGTLHPPVSVAMDDSNSTNSSQNGGQPLDGDLESEEVEVGKEELINSSVTEINESKDENIV